MPKQIIVLDDRSDWKPLVKEPVEHVTNVRDCLELLGRAGRVDELWLDYQLVHETSQPVVDHLAGKALAGRRHKVGEIIVHSNNWDAAAQIVIRLQKIGYNARRGKIDELWERSRAS